MADERALEVQAEGMNVSNDAVNIQADGAEAPVDDQAIVFTMEDADGNEVECRVLYFFHADHNNKDYMVYTTGVVSDEGEEVSAAIYDKDALDAMLRGEDVDMSLEPLTTEIEWAMVADTLKRLSSDDVEIDAGDVVSDDVTLQVADEN